MFAGIFHTHFSDKAVLSSEDINYIRNILLSIGDIENDFYFPILLIPKKIFIPFKVKLNTHQNIRITEDTLYVIN